MSKGKVGIIFVFFMIMALVFEAHLTFAQTLEEEKETYNVTEEEMKEGVEPQEIEISILLQNVGKVDREIGQYWVDFWFAAEGEGIDFTKEKPEFDFINGKDLEFGDEYVEEEYYEVRVQGVFFNEMNFEDFPFESINLKIELEPVTPNNISQVVLVVSPLSSIDSQANVPGWEIAKPIITSDVHIYDEGTDHEESFSRITAKFPIQRSILGSIMVTLVPITLVAAISLIVFFIPENYTPRIYLTAPLLLSLVYLHTGALKGLPPLGYMTIFDYIAIIYYALFVNSIISLGLQMRFQTLAKPDLVKKSNKIQLYFVPIIIAAGLIAIVLR